MRLLTRARHSTVRRGFALQCISTGAQRQNSVSNPHTGSTVSHEVPLINLSDRPKLPMFTCFPKFINIVQRIGANYLLLGITLLNDDTGSITKSIIVSDPKSATTIILNILSRWLEGGGREPVTWGTFINVLTQIGLSELAKELGE